MFFFWSLFHTHLFAITFWGTKYELFLLLGCQQEGAARCAAQHFGLLTCESRESPRHCKDKSSCLKIQCMTAAAWASSLLQNTGFRRSCSHSKPQRVPSTSQYPSWCSQHKAASITGLILVLYTPLTVENKQWCVRAPRNPENSGDEKARWDGSKEKQKIWSCFVRMEWEMKPGEFWVSPAWTRAAVCTFSGLTWFNRSYCPQPQHWGGWRGNIWDQMSFDSDVGKWVCPEKSSLPGFSSWKDWGQKMTGSIQLRILAQTFPAKVTNFALQFCTFYDRKALSSLCSSCSLPQDHKDVIPGQDASLPRRKLMVALNIWPIPTRQG